VVKAGHGIDFGLRAEDHRYALVQTFGGEIEDALATSGGGAAGLLDDEGHRIGFVHQAQLAGLDGDFGVFGVRT